ncbi:MAG: nitrate reductase cytochrome c-type subunit [Paracoccus denitrificans]|uniref:Periplasmic nitrate reductase, electron transfer subunit n=1 Tax=Paracoccus denitrificans TaxID=266 RepID=A0A533I726_PARDE|nr:MAG: nitrate reductase cytochrome c-type subunit [Paracoccus denitrificans]
MMGWFRPLIAVLTLSIGTTAAVAQDNPLRQSIELNGPDPAMEVVEAEPIPRWITDDVRLMRQYPEQPPIIPHSIEGYQLTVNANRCMSCHRREAVEGSGAPMISVTHFMDRDLQMLADVSPRRYFCTQCHVPQADAKPLIGNDFVDMSDMGVQSMGAE